MGNYKKETVGREAKNEIEDLGFGMAPKHVSEDEAVRILSAIKIMLSSSDGSITVQELKKYTGGIDPILWGVILLSGEGHINYVRESGVITMTPEQMQMEYE